MLPPLADCQGVNKILSQTMSLKPTLQMEDELVIPSQPGTPVTATTTPVARTKIIGHNQILNQPSRFDHSGEGVILKEKFKILKNTHKNINHGGLVYTPASTTAQNSKEQYNKIMDTAKVYIR